MKASIREEKETVIKEKKNGNRKFLSCFLTFLMYGGWLAVVVVIFGIVVLIHFWSK